MGIDYYYTREKTYYCKCDKCDFVFFYKCASIDNFERILISGDWTKIKKEWICPECFKKIKD